MKIVAYVTADFRSDFLELQQRAVHRFVDEPVELCVWNNSPDRRAPIRDQISNECRRLGIREHHVTNPDERTANQAHAHALTWGWRQVVIGDMPDVAILLDFDLVPVRRTSIDRMLGEALIAGWSQSRGSVNYYWPGLMLIRPKELPNPRSISLWCSTNVEGEQVDVGGELHLYLKAHPGVFRRDLLGIAELSTRDGTIDWIPESLRRRYENVFGFGVIDDAWLHYRAGSNWNHAPADEIARKFGLFRDLVQGAIRGDIFPGSPASSPAQNPGPRTS